VIEIIPNWHPLFVHFTVGLLSTSVLFYLAGIFIPRRHPWKQQWLNMANWCLWTGCLFAIATAIAGWLAYNSVAHDTASHAAMTLHRNWALPTAATFLVLGLWAIILAKKDRRPGFLFLTFATVAAVVLMITGWLGAEAVFRYGLGVKSLPVVAKGAEGHNHSHSAMHSEAGESENSSAATGSDTPEQVEESQHQHDHHEGVEIAPENDQANQITMPDRETNAEGHNHSHNTMHSETSDSDNSSFTTGNGSAAQMEGSQQQPDHHEGIEISPENDQANQILMPDSEAGAKEHGHSHKSMHSETSESENSSIATENDSSIQMEESQHQHNHESTEKTTENKQVIEKKHTHKTMPDFELEAQGQQAVADQHSYGSKGIEPSTASVDEGKSNPDTGKMTSDQPPSNDDHQHNH
jgi:uncharacterized membrane protein